MMRVVVRGAAAVAAWIVAWVAVAVMLVGLAAMTPATLVCAVSDRASDAALCAIDWWVEVTAERAIEWAARVTWGVPPCD